MKNKVLEVKFTKFNEEFSEGRIVYQNEKVLRRGDVSDWTLTYTP